MLISVVIPCCNAEDWLAQTIGSVLDQSRPPHEVIVVDDGSTDGSLALVRRFEARTGGRVRVLSECSGHASRTRNIGYSIATGDALMFLDADDVLAPNTLEALSDALLTTSGAVAACPWLRLDRIEGRWVGRPASCAPRRPDQDALSAWLTGWYYPPCSVLWSREAFVHTGGWDEKAVVNQDGDLMMRALIAGIPLVEIPTGVSFYRRLPQGQASLSGKRLSRDGLAGRISVFEKIASLLEEQGRLDTYRAPIREAFARVAADAADCRHADLSKRARSLARLYGPSPWFRAKARGRAVRIMGWRNRPVGNGPGGPMSPPLHDAFGEIRFGLDQAEQVLRLDPLPIPESPVPSRAATFRPVVSVIIPTFNRAHVLPRALRSVLGQGFSDFEVLVVDDGPSDETASVVAGFDDARLRYLRQPENRGVAAARNRGMREARGTFIAFLDDDDEWFPEKLEKQVDLFRRSPPEVGIIYTGVETVLGDGSRTVQRASDRGDLYREMLAGNVLHGCPSNGMMRRQIITEVGFFDEHLPAIEDYDYWLRVCRRYQVDCIAEPLSRYHDDRTPTAGTVADEMRRSRNVTANLAARAQFYRKHRAQMRRAGMAHLFLLDSARRHLAPPCNDVQGARSLAIQAVLRKPTSLTAVRALAGLLASSGLRMIFRSGRNARNYPDCSA